MSQEKLVNAIKSGSLQEVKTEIDLMTDDYMKKLVEGKSLLFIACEHKRFLIVKKLLSTGLFDVNQPTKCLKKIPGDRFDKTRTVYEDGVTPLCYCCGVGYYYIVEELLSNPKIDPNKKSKLYHPLVWSMTMPGKMSVYSPDISKFIDKKKSLDNAINCRNVVLGHSETRFSFLTLFMSFELEEQISNHFNDTKKLVQQPSRYTIPTKSDERKTLTPLYMACKLGDKALPLVKWLGTDIDVNTGKVKEESYMDVYGEKRYYISKVISPLALCCKKNYVELAKYLLSREEIDVHKKVIFSKMKVVPFGRSYRDEELKSEKSILEYSEACKKGYVDIIKVLLLKGAWDPSSPNPDTSYKDVDYLFTAFKKHKNTFFRAFKKMLEPEEEAEEEAEEAEGEGEMEEEAEGEEGEGEMEEEYFLSEEYLLSEDEDPLSEDEDLFLEEMEVEMPEFNF